MSTNSANDRLLLCCAGTLDRPEREREIRSCLSAGPDWAALIEEAENHGMAPLVYWYLQSCPEDVPRDAMEALRQRFLASARQGLFLTAKLHRILRLFGQHGIQAIPFKGPVLASTLYENPALRTYGDLDILVCPPQVFAALRLLSRIGFASIPYYGPRVEAQILKREWQYQLTRSDDKYFVEIHWTVIPWYQVLRLPVETWWERSMASTIDDRPVRRLAPEDLLTALSVHGSRHMWRSLNWIADLARLLKSTEGMDWEYVLRRDQPPDLLRLIRLGLMVVEGVPGTRLPAEVSAECRRDPVAVEYADRFRRSLFPHGGRKDLESFTRFQLRMKSRRIDRIRYCYRVVATPTLHEWDLGLPGFLYPLYFLTRPFRLAAKYLRRRRPAGREDEGLRD